MRVGLVLGAGGVLGGAWLTGGLHALAEDTEWDPGSADYIVGTSAGSMVGALLAAGVPPWFMVAHSAGETFKGLSGPDGRAAADADRAAGAVFRLHRGLPLLGPGSLRLALTTLAQPLRHTPLQLLTGWLPQGLVSTDSLEETVGRVVAEGWVGHPNFWAIACDYDSGQRTTFGRVGGPRADVAKAVAASCAIPGFYRPVRIGRRRYVDGGVCSPSNLDLLKGLGLDLVICLNPTSSLERAASSSPLARVVAASRAASGRRLGNEARKVRATGTRVVLIQPTARDHEVMGNNLMRTRRRNEVIERAVETVREQLRRPEVAAAIAGLQPGEPHKVRKPPGPPSSWPAITPAVGRRRQRRAA
jgi:NTE family protein